MIPGPELTGGAYFFCVDCKEGKFGAPIDQEIALEELPKNVQDWLAHHTGHGQNGIIPGAQFLSDFLGQGYIDVDRPDLEPILTHLGGDSSPDKAAPLGAPGGAAGAKDLARRMNAQRRVPFTTQDAQEVYNRETNQGTNQSSASGIPQTVTDSVANRFFLEENIQRIVVLKERIAHDTEELEARNKIHEGFAELNKIRIAKEGAKATST